MNRIISIDQYITTVRRDVTADLLSHKYCWVSWSIKLSPISGFSHALHCWLLHRVRACALDDEWWAVLLWSQVCWCLPCYRHQLVVCLHYQQVLPKSRGPPEYIWDLLALWLSVCGWCHLRHFVCTRDQGKESTRHQEILRRGEERPQWHTKQSLWRQWVMIEWRKKGLCSKDPWGPHCVIKMCV